MKKHQKSLKNYPSKTDDYLQVDLDFLKVLEKYCYIFYLVY